MSYYPNESWPSEPYSGQWGASPQVPPPPVVPFRPLGLGNLFDGTFSAIRSNPKVMFTISLSIMAIVGVMTGIFSAFLPEETITGVNFGNEVTFELEATDAMGMFQGLGVQGIMSLVSAAASLLVTGMLVLSVTNSVIGTNLDLRATWEELKPQIWRLIGTALLVWLIITVAALAIFIIPTVLIVAFSFGSGSDIPAGTVVALLLLIPIGIALIVWLSVRLYFATVVAVVEGANPGTALRRSWTLTRVAFWRTLGRIILMGIIMAIVVGLLGSAVSILIMALGAVLPWPLTAFLLALTSSLVTGLAMPFSSAFTSLMYVDERIRKDNLAPALQAAWEQNASV